MNIPTTTTKGEQAKSQLIAAALAQFGEYGLHATTRDIAALAGQNIAAITYYFGSKRIYTSPAPSGLPIFLAKNFAPMLKKRNVCLASLSLTGTPYASLFCSPART